MIYLNEQKEFPPLFEAVGCVCCCEGQILLLKRRADKSYPNHWGLPSGKVEANESRIGAMVRELFEETTILTSVENLQLFKTYHIVKEDFSFLYTVYLHRLIKMPSVTIEEDEHTTFAWFTTDDALRLKLIPDLDYCLKDIFPALGLHPVQHDLFTGLPTNLAHTTSALEQLATAGLTNNSNHSGDSSKIYWVSFGPPGAGKTTALKAMAKNDTLLQFVEDTAILRKGTRLNFYLHKAWQEEQRAFFFHFQMDVLLARFRCADAAPNYSLVDETIYSTLAYSKALYNLRWIKDYEYQTFYMHYRTYLALLPKPRAIFYLDCDVATIMKRKDHRGRKIEKLYAVDYITALSCAFSEVADDLSKDLNVVRIDTSQLRVSEIVRLHAPTNSDQYR